MADPKVPTKANRLDLARLKDLSVAAVVDANPEVAQQTQGNAIYGNFMGGDGSFQHPWGVAFPNDGSTKPLSNLHVEAQTSSADYLYDKRLASNGKSSYETKVDVDADKRTFKVNVQHWGSNGTPESGLGHNFTEAISYLPETLYQAAKAGVIGQEGERTGYFDNQGKAHLNPRAVPADMYEKMQNPQAPNPMTYVQSTADKIAEKIVDGYNSDKAAPAVKVKVPGFKP